MYFNSFSRCILLITVCCGLSGCATTPEASPESRALALSTSPPPGKAALYIFRRPALQAGGILLGVTIDNEPVGALGWKSFLRANLAPGKHRVEIVHEDTIKVDTGTVNYFSYKPSLTGGHLTRISDVEGLQLMQSYRLAGNGLPDNLVTVSDIASNQSPAALQTTPSPGKAAVYVFRPFQLELTKFLFKMSVDDVPLGTLAHKTFLHMDIDPGQHQVSEQNSKMSTSFKASIGKNSYILVKFNASSTISFVALSEAQGLELLKKYKPNGAL